LKVYVLNHHQQQSMQKVAVEGLQVVQEFNAYININRYKSIHLHIFTVTHENVLLHCTYFNACLFFYCN
jgi:hypothetical protein